MLIDLEVYSALQNVPDFPLSLGSNEAEDPIHIRDIRGLGPVKANVNTRGYGSQDGEFSTGSLQGKRNIVLVVGFNPDWVNNTYSSLRQQLYSYFMPKRLVRLRFFTDNLPPCEIEGIVEDVEPNVFSKDPEVQISILCLLPDFVGCDAQVVQGTAKANSALVDFVSEGTTTAPFVLEVRSNSGSYDGPFRVENDYRVFRLSAPVDPFFYLYINSRVGNKIARSVFAPTLSFDNLMYAVTADSTWPFIEPGYNRLRVLTESDVPLQWKLTYFNRFGGL